MKSNEITLEYAILGRVYCLLKTFRTGLKQIIELESKISEGDYSTSNQSEKIKFIVEKFQNLDKLWLEGTFQFKKKLQKVMFPDGMVVKADNKLLLTDNIEELFFIIGRFSESCGNKKSGASKMYFENSALVPLSGKETNFLIEDIGLIDKFTMVNKEIKN